MNQMTEPSMYERPERPDWPLNALPKHWIEALFAKMSAFYGSRFATMWSGSKPDEVQKAWAIELAKLSKQQLKAGSDALTAFAKPPNLPEFVAHCRNTRAEMASFDAPRLEHLPPMSPEKAAAGLKEVRARATRVVKSEGGSAAWAFEVLMRGKSKHLDKPLAYQVIRCASDAISSSAGKRAIDQCEDPALRAEYQQIRDAVLDSYREQGRQAWEVR